MKDGVIAKELMRKDAHDVLLKKNVDCKVMPLPWSDFSIMHI